MKQLVFHLLLFGILFQAQAQDVMVAVKKGSALVNSAKLQSNSLPKKITKSTVINAESGTVLLVKKGDKYTKIYCPCNDLKYSEIVKNIGQQSVKSNSYTQVIFNKPIENDGGTQKGSVSRGEGQEQTFFINIEDSALIYNTAFFIEWKSPSELKYTVVPQLKNLQTQQVEPHAKPNGFEVAPLTSGWYQLYFEAQTILDGKAVNLKLNVPFYIPTDEERKNISSEINEIREGTMDLGEDIFELFLNDYLLTHRIAGY